MCYYGYIVGEREEGKFTSRVADGVFVGSFTMSNPNQPPIYLTENTATTRTYYYHVN